MCVDIGEAGEREGLCVFFLSLDGGKEINGIKGIGGGGGNSSFLPMDIPSLVGRRSLPLPLGLGLSSPRPAASPLSLAVNCPRELRRSLLAT